MVLFLSHHRSIWCVVVYSCLYVCVSVCLCVFFGLFVGQFLLREADGGKNRAKVSAPGKPQGISQHYRLRFDVFLRFFVDKDVFILYLMCWLEEISFFTEFDHLFFSFFFVFLMTSYGSILVSETRQ